MSESRRPLLWIGVPVLVAMAVTHIYDQRPILAQEAKAPPAGFAVVELFTSQGCSSCPPADDLLAEIAEDARKKGQRVYTLSHHVHYWDKLGWTDPYGSKAATARQKRYARALGERRLYTPQMVVNGQHSFVGSSRSKARKAIEAGLKGDAGQALSLAVSAAKTGRTLTVTYDAPASKTTLLTLALIEDGLSSKVTRGENGGRTLKHTSVVRGLTRVRLEAGKGEVTLQVPTGLRPTSSHVIGLIQDTKTLRILGVQTARWEPATGK